jgi:hypothetical protein
MRAIFIIFGLLYLTVGFSQTKNDTVFLKKEKFGTVYITRDTSIQEYKWVAADLKDKDFLHYKEYYDALLKDSVIQVKHFYLKELPAKWSPIYIIKNKYYLYAPSDWMFNYGFIVKDSLVIREYTDGPDVMIILDYKQKSKNEFFFKLHTQHGNEYLTIKIIDSKLGIAVWKFVGNNYWDYRLMVNSKNVYKFPMVKCDCGENKCVIEYEFEKLDYEKIIKNAR